MQPVSRKPAVFVLSEREHAYFDLIREAGLAICDVPFEANILLADPPLFAQKVEDFPNLQWVQSTFAGVDSLVGCVLPETCRLTVVKGIFGASVAEYVFAHGLSHVRQLKQYRDSQIIGLWQPIEFEPLSGSELVVLGTGSIGQHLAKTAKAFGMRVTGLNSRGQKIDGFDDVIASQQLPEALRKARWLVNTLPHTSITDGLLSDFRLQNCTGVLFFNVGRGSIVKERDLLDALAAGWVAHAFLDVFETEPLPQDSLLWKHPDVSITPHIAAPSLANDVFNVFLDNYRLFVQGRPLRYEVDLNNGY